MPAVYDVSPIYGTMMIGTFLNLWLSSVEIGQALQYFNQARKDGMALRFAVVGLVFFNLLSTASTCALTYTSTITHWGDLSFLPIQPYSLSVFVIGLASSTLIAQVFLAFRATRLMMNGAIQWSMRFFLCLGPLAAFSAAIWATVGTIQYPSPTGEARARLIVPGKMMLITNAVSDVLITIVFVAELLRVKRAHPTVALTGNNRSSKMIRHLILNAIKTGAVTSTFALIALALFLGIPNTNAPVTDTFFLGRVYGLSMLANLNARQGDNDPTLSPGTSTGFSIRKKNGNNSPYVDGISVVTETAVCRDDHHRESPIQLDKMNQVPYEYGDDKDAYTRGPGAV